MIGRDPGLQPERTLLSWQRTGWSMLVPAMLCLRGWSHTGDALYALTSLLLFAGTIMLLSARARGRHYAISLIVTIACGMLGIMLIKMYLAIPR
ncbi:MAG: DUF202 domain-containing protein [Leclercia sp.]